MVARQVSVYLVLVLTYKKEQISNQHTLNRLSAAYLFMGEMSNSNLVEIFT